MVDLGGLMGGGILALLAALGTIFLVVLLAFYLYSAFALMAMAKRTKTPNGWLAFIPIANIYLMTQIGKLPAWWTLAVVLPFIPIVGGMALLAVMIYIWWKIAEALKRPGWWGILMIIPIANLVIMGIMAWGK